LVLAVLLVIMEQIVLLILLPLHWAVVVAVLVFLEVVMVE
jgi:hypothetical protein